MRASYGAWARRKTAEDQPIRRHARSPTHEALVSVDLDRGRYPRVPRSSSAPAHPLLPRICETDKLQCVTALVAYCTRESGRHSLACRRVSAHETVPRRRRRQPDLHTGVDIHRTQLTHPASIYWTRFQSRSSSAANRHGSQRGVLRRRRRRGDPLLN